MTSRLLLALTPCVLLVSCDYSYKIATDYEIVRVYGSTFGIVHGNLVVVGDSVCGYAVTSNYIIGEITHKTLAPGDTSTTSEGYFILDMRSDALTQGLSKEEWLAKLKECGIESTPELQKPSRTRALGVAFQRAKMKGKREKGAGND